MYCMSIYAGRRVRFVHVLSKLHHEFPRDKLRLAPRFLSQPPPPSVTLPNGHDLNLLRRLLLS